MRLVLPCVAALLVAGCNCGSSSPAPRVVDAERSSVSVDRTSVPADGVEVATFTFQLLDQDGAPVSWQAITLTVSGEENQLEQPSATDENGEAQATLASTLAQTKSVVASVGELTFPAQEIVFTQVPRKLLFLVQPSAAPSGEAIAPPMQVVVADSHDKVVPLANNPVTLTLGVNPSGALLSGQTTREPWEGIATFEGLSLDAPGEGYSLVATSPGLQPATSAPFNVSLGPPARLAFLTQPRSVLAGENLAAPLTIELLDPRGNRLTSETAQVSLGIGHHAGPGTLSGTLTADAVNGVAIFSSLTLDRTGAGYTLVATAPGYAGATSAPFDLSPAAAARLAVLTSPSQGVAGVALTPVPTVGLYDAFGNVTTGTPEVTLALGASPDGGVLQGTLTATAVAGLASFPGLVLETAAPGYTLQATSPGLSGDTSPPFPVGAAAPNPGQSSLAVGTPSPRVADGLAAFSFSVTVKDGFGNPAPGVAITLEASGSGNLIESPPLTDAAGMATGTLRSTRAEVKSVTARAGSVDLGAPVTVSFEAGPPSATASKVELTSGPPLTADGVSATTVTVTVTDAQGNPLPNLQVTLAASGVGNVIGQPANLTDAGGIATGTLASTRAEAKKVFATVGSALALVQQPSISFVPGPPSPTATLFSATPSSFLVADGVALSTFAITLRDQLENPLSGQTVVLTSSGTLDTFTQPGPTAADGKTSGTLSSTRAEVKTITATVGTTVVGTLDVTFVPDLPSATQSTLVASPTTGITADGTAASTLTVTVLDGQGNPVPNKLVTFAASGTGNLLTQPSGLTGPSGVATGTLASTVPETKTVSASVGSLLLTSEVSVEFVP